MTTTQTESLLASLTAYAEDIPAGPQRRELDRLIAVQADEGQRRIIQNRAMLYPILVLALCAAVLWFLGVAVIPTFAEMFDEFGLLVPAPTAMVLGLSNQIIEHPIRLTVLAISLVVIAYLIHRWFHHFAIGTRYFGLVYMGTTPQLLVMAGICNRLSARLSEGRPLPETLRMASEDCEDRYYRVALRTLADDAQRNPEEMARSSVVHNFPANLIHALTAGIDGGANIPLLQTLAENYREQAAGRWDIGRGFAGPLATLLVSIVVGIVVLSLFQPLVLLISGLS